MEQRLISNAKCAVNILRPGAIYGPFSKHAREWFFVKRLLESRRHILLAYEAQSKFHTTSVDNIAAGIFACSRGRLPIYTNVLDPIAPTVGQIGKAIMSILGIEANIIGLPGQGFPPKLGRSPWSIPKPFVGEPSANYVSAGNYADLVGSAIKHLRDNVDLQGWKTALPQLAAYPFDLFDYEAEDEFLSTYQ